MLPRENNNENNKKLKYSLAATAGFVSMSACFALASSMTYKINNFRPEDADKNAGDYYMETAHYLFCAQFVLTTIGATACLAKAAYHGKNALAGCVGTLFHKNSSNPDASNPEQDSHYVPIDDQEKNLENEATKGLRLQ